MSQQTPATSGEMEDTGLDGQVGGNPGGEEVPRPTASRPLTVPATSALFMSPGPRSVGISAAWETDPSRISKIVRNCPTRLLPSGAAAMS